LIQESDLADRRIRFCRFAGLASGFLANWICDSLALRRVGDGDCDGGHGNGARRAGRIFPPRLDQIIDLDAQWRAGANDRLAVFGERFGGYTDGPGQPPLPTRLMAGLAILKHTFDLSDESPLRALDREPLLPNICAAGFFRHDLPFDRSC